MPRTFSSANIVTGLGACGLTGAFTIVALVKKGDDSNFQWIVGVNDSTTAFKYGLCFDGTTLTGVVNGFGDVTGPTLTVANGYMLVGFGKAAGTSTPRFHSYIYGTDTFSHTNASGTQGDPASGAGEIKFGVAFNGAEAYAGDTAQLAIFNRNLADVEFEQLAFSLQGWYAAAPVGAWEFDQESTSMPIRDWTGNGANQTSISGTSVATASVPVFSYGAAVIVPGIAAASGDATATPAAVNATTSVPAPTVSGAATVAPAVVNATTSVPAPTVSGGAVTVATAVSAVVSVPAPTVSGGATVAASVINAVVSVPAPAVSAGGSVNVSPVAVQVSASVPAPAVSGGALAVVSAVSATTSVPAPVVSGGALVVPAAVSAVASVPAPTVSVTGSATVTPAAIMVTVAIPLPQLALTLPGWPPAVSRRPVGVVVSTNSGQTVVSRSAQGRS